MNSIECVGCGAELDPDAVDYCGECSLPVESSLEDWNETAVDDQSTERQQADGTPTARESSSQDPQQSADESDAPATTEMSCPQCGSSHEPEQNYCRSCGAELSTDEAPETTEIGDAESESEWLEASISIGDKSIPLKDGELIGAKLRPLVTDLRSREEALCISREQLEVAIDDESEQCWLRDAGSKNGTVLNGQELPTDEFQEVTDGDTIVLPPDVEATLRVTTVGWADPDAQPPRE